MAESSSSTQNPTMPEAPSSTQNPENNPSPEISPQDKGKNILYFSFSLTPAYKLKHAMAALAEPDLNPNKLARIDVSKAGFEMTVYDKFDYCEGGPSDELTGYLGLKANALSRFECNVPMTRMIGKLDKIDEFLGNAGDKDYVKVFCHDGLKLCFEFVKLNESGVPQCHMITASVINVSMLNKFPTVSCSLEIRIPSDKMRPLFTAIMFLVSDGIIPSYATAVVYKTVTIQAGNFGVRLEEPSKEGMLFFIKCWKALEKASLLNDNCLLYRVRHPSEHIMLRFSLKELGDLVILKPTQRCFSDGLTPMLFTFGPLN